MGADFLFQILPLAKLDDERKAELHKLFESLTEQDIADLRDSVFRDDGTREELIAEMDDQVLQYDQCRDHRDCGTLYLEGRWFILSGGMSWGDDPTDSYRTLEVLATIPGVWQQLQLWSRDDVIANLAKSEP